MTSLIMSSCCTLRLKRRRAFSRDSPSCSRTSAKLTHPQTRPDGPNSYYKDLTASQEEVGKFWAVAAGRGSWDHFETFLGSQQRAGLRRNRRSLHMLALPFRKDKLRSRYRLQEWRNESNVNGRGRGLLRHMGMTQRKGRLCWARVAGRGGSGRNAGASRYRRE